jgi:hypothetical protein
LDHVENNFGTETEVGYTLCIAEDKLQQCQRIAIENGKEEVSANLDTGCELTLMNENL